MFKNICLSFYTLRSRDFIGSCEFHPYINFSWSFQPVLGKLWLLLNPQGILQLHCLWVSTGQILCFEAFHFSSLAAIWLLTFGFMTFILFLLSSSMLIYPSYVQYQFKILSWEFIGKPLWNGHQKTSCSSPRTSLKISSSFTTMCAIFVLKVL